MMRKTNDDEALWAALGDVDLAPGADMSPSADPDLLFEVLRTQVAEAVAKAMVERNLNENQLATRLGVTRQAVNEALAMKGNMTLRTLAKFSAALGCEVGIVLRSAGSDSAPQASPVSNRSRASHRAEQPVPATVARGTSTPHRRGKLGVVAEGK